MPTPAPGDYLIGMFVGLLTGVLALIVLNFANVSFPHRASVVLFGTPVLFGCGVWLGMFLGRRLQPFFAELGKFSAVGFLSSSLDFAVLNVVSAVTGVTAGFVIGSINIPGFSLATLNAYFWNKLWVFRAAADRRSLLREMPHFFLVTGIGLAINSAVLIILTTYTAPAALSPVVWLNLSKVIATCAATFWNFFGYRHLVFRRRTGGVPPSLTP